MRLQKLLTAKMSQLKSVLSEMQSVIEWRKLKAFENSLNPPPNLWFNDDTVQELSNQYCRFLSISAEIEHLLEEHPAFMKRSSILKQLNTLHCKLYFLGTDVRVY